MGLHHFILCVKVTKVFPFPIFLVIPHVHLLDLCIFSVMRNPPVGVGGDRTSALYSLRPACVMV